jgi:hypothetical protein
MVSSVLLAHHELQKNRSQSRRDGTEVIIPRPGVENEDRRRVPHVSGSAIAALKEGQR